MDKVNISDIHSSALPACLDITLLISGMCLTAACLKLPVVTTGPVRRGAAGAAQATPLFVAL